MNKLETVDDEGQLAFGEALKEVAGRLGGVTVLSAAVACGATFGPLEKMTAWQRRAVNRALAPYRVHLEFPEPSRRPCSEPILGLPGTPNGHAASDPDPD
jgi:hypothetical protein